MRVHYVQDYGSYLQLLTPLISQLTMLMAPGAYAIPEIDVKVTNVYTNTVPTDALRGAGRPEATHAIERMMDILAKEVGITRTEVRRRNFPAEWPFTSAIGLVYDSGDYAKTLDRLLELSDDQATFERRRTEAAARGKLLGRGLSTWVEICGFAPSDVARTRSGSRREGGRARPCVCTRPARSRSSRARRRTDRDTRLRGRRSSRPSSASRSTTSR